MPYLGRPTSVAPSGLAHPLLSTGCCQNAGCCCIDQVGGVLDDGAHSDVMRPARRSAESASRATAFDHAMVRLDRCGDLPANFNMTGAHLEERMRLDPAITTFSARPHQCHSNDGEGSFKILAVRYDWPCED